MPTTEKKRFKDWFDEDAVRRLAEQLHAVYPEFDRSEFRKAACLNLSSLEMNARVAQFSEAMALFLPEDKDQAIRILNASLPEKLPDTEQVTDGWLQWPLGKFIADYGLPHFETSMTAMIELTQRFSSEFAVRPFVEHRQKETLGKLTALTTHPSAHVRRWCSEGTRPLLPWGKKLHALLKDPTPVWPILEALKDDPEPYVRKSVANHLNDISKHHPDLVVERFREWIKDAPPQRSWVIRHALRTLLKGGHPGALELLGFKKPAGLAVNLNILPKKISIGESIRLECSLSNSGKAPQKLMIDYAINYQRQKGKVGRKVFKWKEITLQPGESIQLKKKQSFQVTSIRALYPGIHLIQIQVNGVQRTEASFELAEEA